MKAVYETGLLKVHTVCFMKAVRGFLWLSFYYLHSLCPWAALLCLSWRSEGLHFVVDGAHCRSPKERHYNFHPFWNGKWGNF